MSVDGFAFDLSAAEWRKGVTDEKALAEALAVRLEQALPGKVIVERSHSWFSKDAPLRSIVVNFDDEQFQLIYDKRDGVRTLKAKVVRGIVLKTTPVEFSEWLDDLFSTLQTYAQHHEDTREAMQRFLFS